jgi:hypothetical protein
MSFDALVPKRATVTGGADHLESAEQRVRRGRRRCRHGCATQPVDRAHALQEHSRDRVVKITGVDAVLEEYVGVGGC